MVSCIIDFAYSLTCTSHLVLCSAVGKYVKTINLDDELRIAEKG